MVVTLENKAISSKQELSSEVLAKIDSWTAKYPKDQRQSAVIPALHIVQDAYDGSLTSDLMDALAAYLGMPNISVYEVATFYSMYEHKPVGKNKLSVCTNISCMLRGSDNVLAHLKTRLGISVGEMTEDGKFSIKEVECMGACGGAPMLELNKVYYENLTPEKLDEIIDAVK
ncbi:MAG: NAD(P)H-dependent oxidoreductase subunit E [Gammaproteobacteria bacterium]|nr:NAD(P)H-dependent oxidoreductase subunit E [Gammaproteobacteria bacterium]